MGERVARARTAKEAVAGTLRPDTHHPHFFYRHLDRGSPLERPLNLLPLQSGQGGKTKKRFRMYVSEDLKNIPTFDQIRELENAEDTVDRESLIHQVLDGLYNNGGVEESTYWRLKEDPERAMQFPQVAVPIMMTENGVNGMRKKVLERTKAFLN